MKPSKPKRPASPRRQRRKANRKHAGFLGALRGKVISRAKTEELFSTGEQWKAESDQALPKAAALNWRLRVPKSGAVKLSAAVLDKLGAWPGDVLAVYARQFATHKEIILRILPHGFTPTEWEKWERRTLRQMAKDIQAGRGVPFKQRLSDWREVLKTECPKITRKQWAECLRPE
ncbi:MAG: hypothetical protein MUF81_04030 [Verrucomicrobia bacterium]|nr:hypothetical protein [Verrucomicrobiota bacterium]